MHRRDGDRRAPDFRHADRVQTRRRLAGSQEMLPAHLRVQKVSHISRCHKICPGADPDEMVLMGTLLDRAVPGGNTSDLRGIAVTFNDEQISSLQCRSRHFCRRCAQGLDFAESTVPSRRSQLSGTASRRAIQRGYARPGVRPAHPTPSRRSEPQRFSGQTQAFQTCRGRSIAGGRRGGRGLRGVWPATHPPDPECPRSSAAMARKVARWSSRRCRCDLLEERSHRGLSVSVPPSGGD